MKIEVIKTLSGQAGSFEYNQAESIVRPRQVARLLAYNKEGKS